MTLDLCRVAICTIFSKHTLISCAGALAIGKLCRSGTSHSHAPSPGNLKLPAVYICKPTLASPVSPGLSECDFFLSAMSMSISVFCGDYEALAMTRGQYRSPSPLMLTKDCMLVMSQHPYVTLKGIFRVYLLFCDTAGEANFTDIRFSGLKIGMLSVQYIYKSLYLEERLL